MMWPALPIVAGLALVVAACQSSPPPQPRASVDEALLAAQALEAGDYASAAGLYRQALVKAPDSLGLHYGLGVATSHLDLKPEAIREFRWVVERGEAGKVEVDNARNWLVRVGALAPRAAGTAQPTAPASATAEERPNSATATLEGQALSPDGPQREPVKRMALYLVEHPSRVNYYRLRTDENGRFVFPRVAPGIYKLSDRVVGQPKWRLRVEVKPAQAVSLDLGPDNSTKVRDDFPE